MTFSVLVSAVQKNIPELIKTMNIKTDAVVVNQCDKDRIDTYRIDNFEILQIDQNDRGVGLSRNTAIANSQADIVLFSDEDIVYEDGYQDKVIAAFIKYPDASVITFNFDVDERRRTYNNSDDHRVKWNNYGRYPAYAIAAKRKDLIDKNIKYSLLFGGGAKYSNGEDSVFLHDCLKNKLIIMAVNTKLGKEVYRESTWFKGYTEKFFFDRGVLYSVLYGKAAAALGFRFLFKNKKSMCTDISFGKAYALLRDGIRKGKSL